MGSLVRFGVAGEGWKRMMFSPCPSQSGGCSPETLGGWLALMTFLAWFIFIIAALLEVGGDAAIRRGLRGGGWFFVVAGFVALGSYGLVVNSAKTWDFSKLIGVYVAFFALVSVLCGRYIFRESIPPSTWLGLSLIIAGGLVIQFGNQR
jgi:multidrug transporter EmrE-like cation transporter